MLMKENIKFNCIMGQFSFPERCLVCILNKVNVFKKSHMERKAEDKDHKKKGVK